MARTPQGTETDVNFWDAAVRAFKETVLNLSYYVLKQPETYAPLDLVPVYQRTYSYYAVVPYSVSPPALHAPAANGKTQQLMRFLDFAIMWQMWVVSTALSTVAMCSLQAQGAAGQVPCRNFESL